jgi:hypothetical protein
MIPDPNGQEIPGNYYHQESDLTGGLPINLDSLRDGPPGTKPFYPYSTLIRYVPPRAVQIPPGRCRRLACTYYNADMPSRVLRTRNYFLRIFTMRSNQE